MNSNALVPLLAALLGLVVVFLLLANRLLLSASLRSRLPRSFWFIVEYAWLLLALFGVLQAILEVVRFDAQRTLSNREQDLQIEFRQLRMGVSSVTGMFGRGESGDAYMKWYSYCESVLDRGPDDWKWAFFIGQNEDLIRPRASSRESRIPQGLVEFPRIEPSHPYADVVRDLLVRMSDLHERFLSLRRDQAVAAQASTSSWSRWLFFVLFPPIFALRVTKVTHDRDKSVQHGAA